MEIYERVHSRRDLDEMFAQKDVPGLIDALNAESQLTPFPIKITAQQIMGLMPHREIIFSVLQDAADGGDVSQRARELMSQEGTDATELRWDPPRVEWYGLMSALWNDDGTEK